MKQFVAVILALLTVLSLFVLCSCANKEVTDDGKLRVVTTIFPEYDFARIIGADKVSVSMLVDSGDIHSFEPSLSDVNKIANADVFVYIGGSAGTWVDGVLDRIDTNRVRVVDLSKCVDELCFVHDEGEHDHDHGEECGIADEHIWTSVPNAAKMCEAIAEAMIGADSENEAYYRQNLEDYKKRLDTLDALFRSTVNSAKKNTVVVADRFPFLYMFSEYKIEYVAAMMGCTSASDVSLSKVIELANAVRDNQIKVLLHTETSGNNIIDTVEKQLGSYKTDRRMLHSCQYVSRSEIEAGATYISIMTQNANVLREALNGDS